MKRPYGFSPGAFDNYLRACTMAEINPNRVVQTIGNAPASKGVHAKDGTVTVNGIEYDYCAAVDLSVKHPTQLNVRQIKRWLNQLARYGFCAWYRHAGSFANNRHIHAIYTGLPMKEALQKQVIDFLHDRDGLAGHNRETFYTAPPELDLLLRTSFLHHNPQ